MKKITIYYFEKNLTSSLLFKHPLKVIVRENHKRFCQLFMVYVDLYYKVLKTVYASKLTINRENQDHTFRTIYIFMAIPLIYITDTILSFHFSVEFISSLAICASAIIHHDYLFESFNKVTKRSYNPAFEKTGTLIPAGKSML
ncbi:hypothetical protein [Echinicola salinicaeni]|uniref:hypothetical protein n=1 Tax=Echinicola salinicaeni TaxID=2762757 RepID=UPI001647A364|nr:hypothetical protein [Echinicola salinicaeni]